MLLVTTLLSDFSTTAVMSLAYVLSDSAAYAGTSRLSTMTKVNKSVVILFLM